MPGRLVAGVNVVLVVAVAAFWFVALRPQALGGPAGYALVHGTSMEPSYHTGDVVIVRRRAHYRVGDIVAYTVPAGTAGAGAQVIHRLVAGDERRGFVVQGDNRSAPDVWHPTRAEIVGSAWLRIPKAGLLVGLLRSPLLLALLAAAFAVARISRRAKPADDLVASVSHELRTPLTSICGYVELLLEGEAGALTPEQVRFLEVVDRNAGRLHEVVEGLQLTPGGAGTVTLTVPQPRAEGSGTSFLPRERW